MKIIKTSLEGALIVEPKVFGDARGFFMENFNENRDFSGRKLHVAQINTSQSSKGVLRGLHFQAPHAQGKLVWVLAGEVFDVAVDLRSKSSTYGQWDGVLLSATNQRQFWIPEGFAHGFQVTSAHAIFCYACTESFKADCDRALNYADPQLNIEWPDPSGAVLSEKDKCAPTWMQLQDLLTDENITSWC